MQVVSATDRPQQTAWICGHQDYSSHFVMERRDRFPDETRCGKLIVNTQLNKGHFGICEHPQIVLNCGYFPHATVMQLRTHRVGISFDVQSFRYTSKSFLEVAESNLDIEEVFYFRPPGKYRARQGNNYEYTKADRERDKCYCYNACVAYGARIKEGMSEEHARDVLPMNVRQHFVMGANARTIMHLLNLRLKKDAQLEAQVFCTMLLDVFCDWMPEVGSWYREKLAYRAKLSA